jgi:hypothetical protein
MVQEKERTRLPTAAWALPLAGLSLTNLVMNLTKPASAAVEGLPSDQGPTEVVVDGDVRAALAQLLIQGEAVKDKLDAVNNNLVAIVQAMGGTVPTESGTPGRELEPFLQEQKTLSKGERYPAYAISNESGSLVWALIDVSDPNTDVTFKFDGLSWTFNMETLRTQGVDRPLFPGVWLSKYDPLNLHYCLIFAAGNINGIPFSKLCNVLVTLKAPQPFTKPGESCGGRSKYGGEL